MGRSRWLITLATLAVVLGLPGSVLAASGDLDASFNQDGIVRSHPFGAGHLSIGDVVVAAGGKVVVAGHGTDNTLHTISVARFGANGYPDGTCGAGTGFKIINVSGHHGISTGLAVLPDNKILIAGITFDDATNLPRMFLLRLQSNCQRDGSFGSAQGVFLSDFGFAGGARAGQLVVLPNGKILVAGSVAPNFEQTNVAVWQFTPDGHPDPSFGGGDGLAILGVSNYADEAQRIVRLDSGKIVVGGTVQTVKNGRFKLLLNGFNADGSIDYSFGAYGIVMHNPTTYDFEHVNGMAVSGNRILVLTNGNGPSNSDLVLLRLKLNGKRDKTWGGGDGQVQLDYGHDESPGDLAIQEDGKIVLAGTRFMSWFVARVLPDGTKDLGFGSGGYTTPIASGHAIGITLDGAGRILTTGLAGADLAVVRQLP